MPRLGELINAERKKDLQKVKAYFRDFKIADSLFEGRNLTLLNETHKLAFGIGILSSKFENVPEFAKPYISQLKSDAIQLISSVMMGNERGFKLFERSIVENLLRYIYHFHHEIEHHLLQIEPSRHKNFKELFEYLKNHPFFKDNSEVKRSVEILQSKYSELSRAVHTSTLFEMNMVNDIISLNRPISDLEKKITDLRTLSQHVVFILSSFHQQEYTTLSLDERRVVALLLTKQQKRKLSRLA